MAFNQFDIIGALRTYCSNNSIRFVWGYDEFYANIENNLFDLQPNELVIVAYLGITPNMGRGSVPIDINYSGQFMIGRKFENASTTSANLDETALQKYDNRILDLYSLFLVHATAFSCLHELTLSVGEMFPLFNEYDVNMDFVMTNTISFVQ